MKKKRILLALLALALAVSVSLPAAMAYFTTNARATGTRTLRLGGSTTIDEVMAGWVKKVTITAQPDSQPMWVRARAWAPNGVNLAYSQGAGWSDPDSDGWYYFTIPLANPADGSSTVLNTTELQIKIDPIPVEEVGKIPEDFEVPVVYESAPVLYGADGTRLDYTNSDIWNQKTTIIEKTN